MGESQRINFMPVAEAFVGLKRPADLSSTTAQQYMNACSGGLQRERRGVGMFKYVSSIVVAIRCRIYTLESRAFHYRSIGDQTSNKKWPIRSVCCCTVTVRQEGSRIF